MRYESLRNFLVFGTIMLLQLTSSKSNELTNPQMMNAHELNWSNIFSR